MDVEADAEELLRLLSLSTRPVVRRALFDLLDSLRARALEQQRYQEARSYPQSSHESGFNGSAVSSALQWTLGDLGNLAANDLSNQLRNGGASLQRATLGDWLLAGGALQPGAGWGAPMQTGQDAGSVLGGVSAALLQGRSLGSSLPFHAAASGPLNMPPQLQQANGLSLPGLSLPDLSSLAISQSAGGKASAAAMQRLQLLQELGLDKGPLHEVPDLLSSSATDVRPTAIRNLPPAPILIPPSGDGSTGAGLLFCKLTTCSWEQSSTSVRVYVPLRGVQTSQIQASFEPSSVEVKIMNLKGKNYLYSIPRTYRPIVPSASVAVASKTRKNVLITLQKLNSATLEDRHWKDLHWSSESDD